MVRMTCKNCAGAINLFRQHRTRQKMRPGHSAESKPHRRPAQEFRIETIGATDNHADVTVAVIAPFTESSGKFCARQCIALFVEGHNTGGFTDGSPKDIGFGFLQGPAVSLSAGLKLLQCHIPGTASTISADEGIDLDIATAADRQNGYPQVPIRRRRAASGAPVARPTKAARYHRNSWSLRGRGERLYPARRSIPNRSRSALRRPPAHSRWP